MKKSKRTLSLTNCKKVFLFFCFCIEIQIYSNAQPVITSLLPAFGKIADTITITGSGFNTGTNANTVFFGGVKSTVLSAASTQLTVRVPYGATYQPVSVTTNNLTSYSNKKFNVTYAEPGGIIPGSIEPYRTFAGGTTPTYIETADIDGDGKTDLVFANNDARTIAVFRNNSLAGIGFDTGYSSPTVGKPESLALADFNGDGKLDIAVISNSPNSLKIFKNKSIPGTISFDTAITYTSTSSYYFLNIKAGDIDLDGKPDIAVTDETQLSVFRNNGNDTTISFEAKKNFYTGSSTGAIEISDLDGNGKPDIIVANSGTTTISILPNVSVPGNIIFNNRISITTVLYPNNVIAGDIDGNGKNDLTVLTSSPHSQLSVFRNTSMGGGSFSFDAAVTTTAGDEAKECKLNDIDGDNKPDITYINQSLGLWRINIVKNKSIAGNISLAPVVTVGYGTLMNVLANGDFDNDGKVDIIGAEYNSGTYFIYRNKSNEPIISSYTPATGTSGTLVSIKGLNLHDVTAVKFGNKPAGAFTILSDSVITATPGTGETGYITVTSPKGLFESLEEFGFNSPTITSFAPESGRIGTPVVISGTNFSLVAVNNIVYFGAVKAVVQTATATSLTVIVPAGAGFQPITVTVNRRTASTTRPFSVTFPAANTIDSATFAARINIALTGQPRDVAVADFDNDGKPDLAIANNSNDYLSVLRNTSSGNTISFAARIDIPVTYSYQNFITTGDLNGDGKLDIVIANNSYGNLSILANTTIGNNISFSVVASTDTFPGTQQFLAGANGVTITDFDGDGKPDIGVANGSNTAFASFFRNISRGSAIIFAAKQDFPSAIFPMNFVSSDLNGDGKPDAIISNWVLNTVSAYKNTSTSGIISFAAKIDSATAAQPYRAGLADLDADGKPDIAVSCYTAGVASVLRNLSTNGNIAFARKVDFQTLADAYGFSVNDIDGDGKPDIVTSSITGNNIAVLRNTSIVGTVSFAVKQLYTTGTQPFSVKAVDLNGDGAPDLISANSNGASISILRNKLLDTFIVAICPPVASTSITSNITGSSYQWQVNTSSGFVNVSNDSNYSGSQSPTLQLNTIPSAWHGYRYRCLVDANYSSVAIIKVKNLWTGTVNNAWENPANWSCGVVPDLNTDVIISSGSVVLNSNTSCGSISIISPASLTITSGNILTVTR